MHTTNPIIFKNIVSGVNDLQLFICKIRQILVCFMYKLVGQGGAMVMTRVVIGSNHGQGKKYYFVFPLCHSDYSTLPHRSVSTGSDVHTRKISLLREEGSSTLETLCPLSI